MFICYFGKEYNNFDVLIRLGCKGAAGMLVFMGDSCGRGGGLGKHLEGNWGFSWWFGSNFQYFRALIFKSHMDSS